MKRTVTIAAIAATSMLSLVAPLALAAQQSPAPLASSAQSVTLVAHMPSAAGVAALASPVPQPSLDDGQTAEMLVLQQSWTLARGETLDAQCQISTGPQTTAELFTSRSQPLAAGFLGSAPFLAPNQTRTFPLVSNFDPVKGSLRDTQILLFVQNAPSDAPSASVRITVVAF